MFFINLHLKYNNKKILKNNKKDIPKLTFKYTFLFNKSINKFIILLLYYFKY